MPPLFTPITISSHTTRTHKFLQFCTSPQLQKSLSYQQQSSSKYKFSSQQSLQYLKQQFQQIIDPLSLIENKKHIIKQKIKKNNSICYDGEVKQYNRRNQKNKRNQKYSFNLFNIHKHFQVQDTDKEQGTSTEEEKDNQLNKFNQNININKGKTQNQTQIQITNFILYEGDEQQSPLLSIDDHKNKQKLNIIQNQQPSINKYKDQQKTPPSNQPNFIKTLTYLLTLFPFKSFFYRLQKKLLSHFSKLTSSDKYIRLIISLLKLHKSFLSQKQKYTQLSKQLSILRRIIQWQSKYQIINEFIKKDNLSGFDVGFKTLEFVENLMDFGNFWGTLLFVRNNNNINNNKINQKNKKILKYVDMLDKYSSDCYFYQCCISFCLYTYNVIQSVIQYKQLFINNKVNLKQNKQTVDEIQNTYRQLQQKFRNIKQMQNYHEQQKQKKQSQQYQQKPQQSQKQSQQKQQKQQPSPITNQQIHSKFLQLQHLLQIKQHHYLISGQSYYTQQQSIKSQLKSNIIKNTLKSIKFLFDIITSYNNYSKRKVIIDTKILAVLSTVSSIISMGLIWKY